MDVLRVLLKKPRTSCLRMLILLFNIFGILSYNHFTVTEAGARETGKFEINLIHRYSPNSPFYNSSMSSLERIQQQILASKSRHGQLKWLQSNELDTSIVTNWGDYLMTIFVGTPPVELFVVLDTSTDLTWFQCTPCMNCYRQTTPMFDPTQSITYKTLPCDVSNHCSTLDSARIACDQGSNQCLYLYSFGNQTSLTRGVLGNDTFSFGSSVGGNKNPSYPLITFGCGYDQFGVFDPQSTGVAGLGNGPLSLIEQLGYQFDYKFSYCLNRANSNSTSKLRFGAPEAVSPQLVTTPFFTNDPVSFYNLVLYGISIGNMNVEVGNNIIIDTATTLTYLTPTIFSSLETMVSSAIGMKPLANSLIESVLCYMPTSRVLTPPDIVFHFTGGDLVLKGNNMFFEYEGGLCLSIVATPGENDPMIFGNMAQVNLEIEYDLLSKTIIFAPKDCSLDY